jgi:hypothetical protein
MDMRSYQMTSVVVASSCNHIKFNESNAANRQDSKTIPSALPDISKVDHWFPFDSLPPIMDDRDEVKGVFGPREAATGQSN